MANRKSETFGRDSFGSDKIRNGYLIVIEGLYEKLSDEREQFEKALDEGYEEAWVMIQEKQKIIEELTKQNEELKEMLKKATDAVYTPIQPVWGKQGEWTIYAQNEQSQPFETKD